jgi:hypothetical protein
MPADIITRRNMHQHIMPRLAARYANQFVVLFADRFAIHAILASAPAFLVLAFSASCNQLRHRRNEVRRRQFADAFLITESGGCSCPDDSSDAPQQEGNDDESP